MNVATLDLNLLRVFEAVYEEGSVGGAARRLGLSQPATSNALGRLRAHLGDPLFVRREGGMSPTQRARQIAGAIQTALLRLREALDPAQEFIPATSTRAFRLSMNDYLEARLVPGISRDVLRAAPGTRLLLTRPNFLYGPPTQELEAGTIDVAVCYAAEEPSPQSGLHSQLLFSEGWVCVTRKDHPIARGRLTRRAFLEIPQVRIVYRGGEAPGQVDRALDARGLERRVGFSGPHLLSVLALVAGSDLLAAVPEGLNRLLGVAGLRSQACPIALPRLSACMVWHQRTQEDPACAWLRSQILAHRPQRRR